MGRMGEFYDYERECERRRMEQSTGYKCLEEHCERLQQENAQLKEALRKSSCGTIACRFCNNPLRTGHTDDCEYVRLIKEREG